MNATPVPLERRERWRKRRAAFCSAAAVALVLSPVAQNWQKDPQDDFPLSYYPMFSERRQATEKLTYILGITGSGERRPLHYQYAGGGGLNQVRRQIRRTVAHGRADALCRKVASKLVQRGKDEFVSVEVVTGVFNLDDYFMGRNRLPVSEEIHSQCPVEPLTP